MTRTENTTQDQSRIKSDLQALLEAGLPPRPFWQHFLQVGQDILGSEAGILWVIPPNTEDLVPQGMCGNVELRQAILQRDMRQVSHVLRAAATDEIVSHHVEPSEDDVWSGRRFLAVPVHSQGELFGILEFIQHVDQPPEELESNRPQLEMNLRQAEEAGQQTQAADPTADSPFLRDFESLSYNVHRSLVLSEVADVAVNDGRNLLQCDRVSISVLRGRKSKILAVSGQDLVNKRSEEVRSLQRIAAEAVAVGEIIEFRADKSDLAPHVRDMLSKHIQLCAAKLIIAIPLYAAARRKPGDKEDPRLEPQRPVVGCLIIEQFRRSRLEPDRENCVQILADTVGLGVANALAQQQVLFHPTRRLLGKGLDFFRGRLLAKTLLVLGLLVAISLGLILVPWEYRVEAEGRLMPEVQRRIFAPWEGVIVSVEVENGQRVSKNDLLLTIYNDDLNAELVRARSELNEKQQLVLALRQEIQEAMETPTEERSITQKKGELQEARIEIDGLKQRIEILADREESLQVRAPIDGVVATFQVEEKLRGRPVSRGEHLVEVMDDQGEWMLELEMPEHRMGHLLRQAHANDGQPLQVEYVLATDVTETYSGRLNLSDVSSRSDAEQEAGVVVKMNVQTDKSQLSIQRIGGQATAKVACGKKALGYVLLGDPWEFLLRHLWI